MPSMHLRRSGSRQEHHHLRGETTAILDLIHPLVFRDLRGSGDMGCYVQGAAEGEVGQGNRGD